MEEVKDIKVQNYMSLKKKKEIGNN